MSTQPIEVIPAEPIVGAAQARRSRRWVWIVVIAVLAAVAAGAVYLVNQSSAAALDGDLAIGHARQGDLQITVVEDAELEAHDYHEIKCKVPGGSTIKTIHVKDGDYVEIGTPLFDLDTEGLEEKITNKELEVENAEATLEAARKDLEIRIKQSETAEKKAGDAVVLAKLDMDKYLLGEYPIERKETKLAIEQARARLKMAKDDLRGSETARKKDFVTEKEVEQNRLAVADADFSLYKALNDLELLEKYTYRYAKRSRESKHEIAKEDLERVTQQNANERAKIERDVQNKLIQFNMRTERLQELKDNLKNSIVVADRAGTINFNHSGHRWRRTMIEEGTKVREDQVVMKIPDTSKMIVKFKISERDRFRVKIRHPATVTVATLPDGQLHATVSAKSSRPDAGAWWANPDVRMFACEAMLNETQPVDISAAKLAPNTTAKIRIFVDTLKDVVYVPIQSVYRIGAKTLLATLTGGAPKFVEVDAGESNEDFIEIRSGVIKDQPILLALPEQLKKELQVLRDAAAKERDQDGEPPPAAPEDFVRPANGRPDGETGQQPKRPALTAAELKAVAQLSAKMRDPANRTPAKQKALLDAIDPELRKKIEPMLKRMTRPRNSEDGQPRRTRGGSGARGGRRGGDAS